MFDLSKCILVTNNDRAAEKWRDSVSQVFLLGTYGAGKGKGPDSYEA